ncbi:MAG TPA: Mu transposase C-terminal domain-containing protein, partial [Ktedonobacteraceae bacterium]|nr:Mu transposase C-terminal domain-containing protein [Ktedonobacteraceae bacterium]
PRHVQLYPDQATAEAYWLMSANPHPAANPPQAHSYQSARSLIVNTTLDWGGHVWTLLNLGETVTSLLPRVGPPLHVPTTFFQQLLETKAILVPSSVDLMQSLSKADSLLAQANTASLQEANRRFVLVQAYIHRKTELYGDVPVRTLRYWKTLFERAQAHYGCGYVGLLPRIAERGNRTRKAPETSCRLMDAIIEERRELIHQRPISEAYLSYREICLANQTPPLSASTFYRRVNQLGRIQQKSTRMEFQATAQVLRGHKSHIQTTSRYGEHPWALAYFDHALLDIELRTPTTGRPLGRPWATFLVDAFSRRIFAVHLSFDPPDYLSYLMALRLCVRRHGRLPYQVVVDKGKPFQSVHVDSLLERCHCVKQTRPGKKRPLGFVLEQFCETTNSRLLQMLLSTQQGLDIHRQSFWTFAKLDEMLSEWAYQIYDRTLHSALGQSPHDAFVQGQAQSNHDQYLHIPFDQDFLVLTLPGPPKGTVTVIPGNGIKLHGIYYWNSAFRSPKVERTQVPVRYDPFDIGVAYAYVQGRWVQCVSQYFGHLHGHSVRELELACQELHRSTSAYQVSKAVTAKRVAEMFAQEEAYEALVLQHMRDLEASSSLQAIGGRRSPPLEDSLAFRNRQSGLEEPPAPIDLEQLSLYEEYR